MLKVVTVCGAGVGSSMMMRLFTQQVLDDAGIEATVDAADISSVSPDNYDILVTASHFADTLRDTTAKIVRIDNMMDKAYLKEQLLLAINEEV